MDLPDRFYYIHQFDSLKYACVLRLSSQDLSLFTGRWMPEGPYYSHVYFQTVMNSQFPQVVLVNTDSPHVVRILFYSTLIGGSEWYTDHQMFTENFIDFVNYNAVFGGKKNNWKEEGF